MEGTPCGQSVHGVVHRVGSAVCRVATQGVGAVRDALGWSSPEELRPLTGAGRGALVGATAGMIVDLKRLQDDLESEVPHGQSPPLQAANFEMSAVQLRSILLRRCDLSGQLECLLPILDCLAPGTHGCRQVRNLLAHTVEKVSEDLQDRLERRGVSGPTTATAIHTTVTKVETAIGELTCFKDRVLARASRPLLVTGKVESTYLPALQRLGRERVVQEGEASIVTGEASIVTHLRAKLRSLHDRHQALSVPVIEACIETFKQIIERSGYKELKGCSERLAKDLVASAKLELLLKLDGSGEAVVLYFVLPAWRRRQFDAALKRQSALTYKNCSWRRQHSKYLPKTDKANCKLECTVLGDTTTKNQGKYSPHTVVVEHVLHLGDDLRPVVECLRQQTTGTELPGDLRRFRRGERPDFDTVMFNYHRFETFAPMMANGVYAMEILNPQQNIVGIEAADQADYEQQVNHLRTKRAVFIRLRDDTDFAQAAYEAVAAAISLLKGEVPALVRWRANPTRTPKPDLDDAYLPVPAERVAREKRILKSRRRRAEVDEALTEKLGEVGGVLDEKLRPMANALRAEWQAEIAAKMAPMEAKIDGVARDVRGLQHGLAGLEGKFQQFEGQLQQLQQTQKSGQEASGGAVLPPETVSSARMAQLVDVTVDWGARWRPHVTSSHDFPIELEEHNTEIMASGYCGVDAALRLVAGQPEREKIVRHLLSKQILNPELPRAKFTWVSTRSDASVPPFTLDAATGGYYRTESEPYVFETGGKRRYLGTFYPLPLCSSWTRLGAALSCICRVGCRFVTANLT